jgi:Mg2+-importing ATPase
MTLGAVDSRREDASAVVVAATRPAADVLADLGTDRGRGLTADEAARRLGRDGPNTVAVGHARFLPVLWRQLNSPLLLLLVVAATASYFVGERSNAVIIGAIVVLSIGLGLVNEYRAERAAEALHSAIRHTTVALRDGRAEVVNVTSLVVGDVVRIGLGDIVPADLRLVDVEELECDESLLTGESLPVAKSVAANAAGAPLAELSGSALMGTVVSSGSAHGVVVATGPRTEFGQLAAGLERRQLETEFQSGLRRFSMLLLVVAAALTAGIFAINVALHRPLIDALLFSLAIAVGITPQLLPAVVSTSLAAGSRRMASVKVLVKRLVCIEDLGDVDVLFTDKTGTLTAGRIAFREAVGTGGSSDEDAIRWGLLCTETTTSERGVGGNPLDLALWQATAATASAAAIADYQRVSLLPFDHERTMASVVVRDASGRLTQVTKGAPEKVFARCTHVPEAAASRLEAEFAAGNRVVAVATRAADPSGRLRAEDERELSLVGLLVFLDPPKPGADAALRRLEKLGVEVKVVTGDNAAVAVTVCEELGLSGRVALTGGQVASMDDATLADAIRVTTIFARVSPEQKSRIVRLHRRTGHGVAFLGDGVNDALALHSADVGISVDSATDVAKDAADVILMEKDLDVLAGGVAEGRRIFANTIKYVLMGTSSNFGNMFSAAAASTFLPFLPMLPSQILLNNLLYDASQLAIPTDNVDEEQVRRPAHWDIGMIRRFMFVFGPISSIFDFMLFGLMLVVFHAQAAEFRSGWFVESLATQTLVIFAIRTRRVPFVRSRPSLPLSLAALTAVALGAVLPLTPLATPLGLAPLPPLFFLALAVMVVVYLGLIEIGKSFFYGPTTPAPRGGRAFSRTRRVQRRSARFNTASRQ